MFHAVCGPGNEATYIAPLQCTVHATSGWLTHMWLSRWRLQCCYTHTFGCSSILYTKMNLLTELMQVFSINNTVSSLLNLLIPASLSQSCCATQFHTTYSAQSQTANSIITTVLWTHLQLLKLRWHCSHPRILGYILVLEIEDDYTN